MNPVEELQKLYEARKETGKMAELVPILVALSEAEDRAATRHMQARALSNIAGAIWKLSDGVIKVTLLGDRYNTPKVHVELSAHGREGSIPLSLDFPSWTKLKVEHEQPEPEDEEDEKDA